MPAPDAASIAAETRACVRLAAPLAASQLAQVGMALSGTLAAAHLGAESMAAYALGWSLYSTVLLLGAGVLTSVGPIAAHAFGEGDRRKLGHVGRHGLIVALCLSAPSIVLLWKTEAVLVAFGQEPALAARAADYGRAAMCGLPASLAFASLRHMAGAVLRPKIVFAITLGAMVLTLVFNFWCVPSLGLSAMGWFGALLQWAMLIALVAFMRTDQAFAGVALLPASARVEWSFVREILSVGWPVGLTFALESGLFTAAALLVGAFGKGALAAHQIAAQVVYVTFMVPSGIGHAAAYRIGHALGAGDRDGARRAAHVALGLGAAVGLGMAVVLYALASPIAGLFLDGADPDSRLIAALAISLLQIAAVFQLADGLQGIAGGALRGIKDTRVPLLLAFVTYGGCGLGAAWALGLSGARGPAGVWWGLGIGLGSTAAAFVWRFEQRVAAFSTRGRK